MLTFAFFFFVCSLKYALNGREVKSIVMQRLVKVDGKIRIDVNYPAGFMDVISLEKTNEHFRLVYDTKGRLRVYHRYGAGAQSLAADVRALLDEGR